MTWEVVSLALVFCLVAFLYSSVGFGGGSSYTALLAVAGFPVVAIPIIALSCNLVVATGGSVRFILAGHFPWKRMLPLFILSIPMAYLAGRYKITPSAYFILLSAALAVAALLLWRKRAISQPDELRPLPFIEGLGVGAALGTLAGLTGIGGGIYLSPILMLRRWAMPKEAAATAALFIVLNSAAGLIGQLSKPGSADHIAMILPLGAAVLIGGTLGSRLGANGLSPAIMQRGTAILVALISIRLLIKSVGMII